MTIAEITSLISNVGFPIGAFLLVFFKLGAIVDKNSEAITKLTEKIDLMCKSQ